jgi:glycosyltransferase involved in cell wall biosynthesis
MATSLPSNFEPKVIVGGNGVLVNKLKEKNIPTTTLAVLSRDVHIFNDIKVFFELISIFKKEAPDIVHLNSSKIGGLGAVAARLAGVQKIIFTAHGWAFNENRTFLSKILIKFLAWTTIILCHKTIAVSEYMKQSFSGWPGVHKKIIVIHNGVFPVDFIPKEEARKKLHSSSDLFWIGTIAELHPIKGHLTTLAALKEIKTPFEYFIIGEGEQRPLLEKTIIEFGLSEKVFLLGHIDNAAQYLKAFDIFILSSYSEGLGYVLLEAGLAGLPCIGTNVGGIPEIITNKETGLLVPAKDTAALSHALTTLLAHSSPSNEYGTELAMVVKNNFSLQACLNKTISLY